MKYNWYMFCIPVSYFILPFDFSHCNGIPDHGYGILIPIIGAHPSTDCPQPIWNGRGPSAWAIHYGYLYTLC